MRFGHVERVTGHLTADVLYLKARRVTSGHKNTAPTSLCLPLTAPSASKLVGQVGARFMP
jgi:hypothetical protein